MVVVVAVVLLVLIFVPGRRVEQPSAGPAPDVVDHRRHQALKRKRR